MVAGLQFRTNPKQRMLEILNKTLSILSRRERREGAGLLFLMVIGMGFEMLSAGLIFPIFSILMNPENLTESVVGAMFGDLVTDIEYNIIITFALIVIIAIFIVKAIFLVFLSWKLASFTYSILATVSQRLFAAYLTQPYMFHLQKNSAQLIRNAVTETQVFALNVVSPALNLITEGMVFLGLCAILIYIEPIGALAVMVVFGMSALLFYWASRRHVIRWGQLRQYHEGKRIQYLQEGLSAAKDVILLGCSKEFLTQYTSHSNQSARVAGFQSVVSQLPRLWLELLAILGLAILLLILLERGEDLAVVVPILGLFGAVAFRIMPSVNRLLIAVNSLRFGTPVVNLIFEESKLSLAGVPRVRSGGRRFRQCLELHRVSYSYPGTGLSAVNGVSLKIARGETVGLIGASGAGKSTLVNLLLGLLNPEEGTITVDGANIYDDLGNWQDQIGYIPQSIYLTDDSLRRNVAFGVPDDEICDHAVQRAISSAQLQGLVSTLPGGLNALVGERGVRLSGGQCQRIGIARALYHDPEVLVLDEATSALDTDTEAEVMKAIEALHGQKTVLIVAHRLSTVAHCDRIYRLDNGSIVDVGSPNSVLKRAFVRSDALVGRKKS